MPDKIAILDTVAREVAAFGRADLFRAPIVGFSSAGDELYKDIKRYAGEQHVYPQEILPDVKTVVSFFIPYTKAVIVSNRGDSVSETYAVAYIEGNKLTDQISRSIVAQLTAQGIGANLVPATHTYDPVALIAGWSHRSAAFIAGIGRFGLNRLLITPKGCAGRFGTVFLALRIAPDARSTSERCLYFKNGSCRYCIEHCPTGALSEQGIDRQRCNRFLLEVDKNFPHLETSDVCGKCLVGPCATIG